MNQQKSEINFRASEPRDASTYAHILNQSWKDTYGEYILVEHIDDEFNIEKLIENFEEYIKDINFELYMIEYKEQVVGVLELGAPEDNYKENMQGIGEWRTCHIKKEFQGLGIGTKAEEFACNRLKALGYKVCCLWVKKQNTKAIRFHEKNGFNKTNYTCEQTVDGAPSFVMEKNLEEE